MAVGIVLSAGSLILRWRRASGVVRDQLKWLSLSVLAVVATMWSSFIPSPIANGIFILAIGSVPVAVGVAVLRHRLYEIDAVLNRTLVFGALTAILTGAFAALLRLLQAVFVAVTGNESDAATVITTLILATAFVPLKRAIEQVVERRFKSAPESVAASEAAPGLAAREVALGSTAVPVDDLEALLRRVVREEVRAAIGEDSRGASPQ